MYLCPGNSPCRPTGGGGEGGNYSAHGENSHVGVIEWTIYPDDHVHIAAGLNGFRPGTRQYLIDQPP